MKTIGNLFFNVLGFLLCAAGVVGGLYMGVWYGFIGGIIAVVEACKTSPIESTAVAFGVARVVFASTLGGVTALVLWCMGSVSFAYAYSLKPARYFRW